MWIKKWIYRLGFRPEPPNPFYSPSYSFIYSFKEKN